MKTVRVFAALPLVLTSAIALAACGGVEAGAAKDDAAMDDAGAETGPGSLPFGEFSGCRWLLNGGSFQSASDPSSVTLAPKGTAIAAVFKSKGQPDVSIDLRSTSDRSATLGASRQGFAGEWAFCGGGAVDVDGGVRVADPAPAQATLSMSSAELTVDEGVVFLQMSGLVDDIQGGPGCAPDRRAGPLAALLVCGAPRASADSTDGEPASAPSRFVDGSYDCTSEVSASLVYHGTKEGVGNGGTGTLVLTADGATLKADYRGDTVARGSLDFVLTSDRSANPVSGQTVDVSCEGFDSTTSAFSFAPTVTHVAAGALTTDGTDVYLTFLGSVPSGTCSGQTSTTVIQCKPKAR